MNITHLLFISLIIIISGCSHRSPFEPKDGPPKLRKDISAVTNAVPKVEPKARYGNHSPYEVFGKTYHVMESSSGYLEEGEASWYGEKFAGRFTSSMEPYDPYAMTAAHKALPLPSYVKVTNLENNRSVIVRVNDRGPFHGNRIIDLSYAAAIKLGYANKGIARVRVEAIDPETFSDNLIANPEPKASQTNPATEQNLANLDSQTNFYLQAGAFSQITSAQRLQDQLRVLLNQTITIQSDTGDHIGTALLHRVFIGPFKSEENARAAQAVIKDTELANPLIVQR